MRDRLATELAEEREATLQQMRDRLATESVKEREARLQKMRLIIVPNSLHCYGVVMQWHVFLQYPV